MRGLGFGFTNPVGRRGACNICLCLVCGGVGGDGGVGGWPLPGY